MAIQHIMKVVVVVKQLAIGNHYEAMTTMFAMIIEGNELW